MDNRVAGLILATKKKKSCFLENKCSDLFSTNCFPELDR